MATTTKVIIASFDPSTATPSIDQATIVRTRGQVVIKLGTYVADLSISGAYGVAIVSSDAFAAGIASIPGPFDDADWDGWYVWRSFGGHYEVKGGESSLLGSWHYEVDSKAMRRIGPNQTLVMIAESQAGEFAIGMHLRTLMKLA